MSRLRIVLAKYGKYLFMRQLLGFLSSLLLAGLNHGVASELRVGRAVVDITPELGTPMQAPQRPPFEVRISDVARDPLQIKAIVLEVDGQKAALVVCDVTSLPIKIVEAARQEISETTNLDATSVMISATHTHTAPQIRPRFVAQADANARRKTEDYVKLLPTRIAEAVHQADRQLVDGRVFVARGHEDSISFNRRFRMRDGTIQTNPGKSDPTILREIIGADGPIDPEVGIVSFETVRGDPLATLVNFSLHLDTIGGYRPSADFPSQMSKLLADVRGPEMLTIFAPGASGNINHYDLLDADRIRREKSPGEAARIGTILTAEVLKASRQLQPLQAGTLQVVRKVVRLNMPSEKGQLLAERFGNLPQFFDGEVDVLNGNGSQQFDAEVQVISLGDDLAWVGFPGEPFVELGLALKQASPFRFTMIHTLANGTIGYIPNLKAYSQPAYEGTASRCAPGSGEQLVEVATRLLVELKQRNRKVP
jgi:hypothetical protein